MSEPINSQYMTVEEYLKFDADASAKHEYVRGHVFAMSGSTEAHNVICSNLVAAIHGSLRGTGCRVFSTDMRVRIETANCFYYPDVVVTCEPYDGRSVFKKAPRLIVEVLSPSTKHVDSREKLVAYKELPSLAQYVIVHQNRVKIEVHTRVSATSWESVFLAGRSDELALQALLEKPLSVSLDLVYEGVEIPFIVEEDEEEYECV